MRNLYSIAALGIVFAFSAVGCENKRVAEDFSPVRPDNATDERRVEENGKEQAGQPMEYAELLKSKNIDPAKLPHLVMDIKGKGQIELELVPQLAPQTTSRIIELVSKGFYNGQRVHRVEPWVVQWGDPQSKDANWQKLPVGTKGSGKQLPYEENDIKMGPGIVAMASTGEKVGGDSQIFILTDNSKGTGESLQGKYAAFGKVTKGMDIVNKIAKGDVITSIKSAAR